MATRTPESIATELGLKFDVQATPDGKWKRFRFDFPDYDKVAVDSKTVSFRGVPKDYEAPKNFIETVQRVTKWREKCGPWLFVGTTDTVAAELTLWTRATVYKFNRANSRKLKAAAKQMEASENYARQLAMSQPTPMQGVRILDELTKLKEPATQALRKTLMEGAQAFEARVAEARAHADGACGCPAAPCPVAQLEAAAAKTAPPPDAASERRATRTETYCPEHADHSHRIMSTLDGGGGDHCKCGLAYPKGADVIPLRKAVG